MAVTIDSFSSFCKYLKMSNVIADFNHGGSILTLSHYDVLGNAKYGDYKRIINEAGLSFSLDNKYFEDKFLDSELLFRGLGFDTVDSVDNSTFEGATIQHDLNMPFPAKMAEKYDVVYDNGTMEHVFNFPQTLRNVFTALKHKGMFFFDSPYWFTPTHGFYNFSPELFSSWFTRNKWDLLGMTAVYRTENYENMLEFPLDGGVFPHMGGMFCGAAIKTDKSTCDMIPQQGVYQNAWIDFEAAINKLKRLSVDKDGAQLALFGTGQIAKRSAAILHKIDKDIQFNWVSDNPIEIGEHFMFGKIIEPLSILERGANLIIASTFQKAIIERLGYLTDSGINLITLFDHVDE